MTFLALPTQAQDEVEKIASPLPPLTVASYLAATTLAVIAWCATVTLIVPTFLSGFSLNLVVYSAYAFAISCGGFRNGRLLAQQTICYEDMLNQALIKSDVAKIAS